MVNDMMSEEARANLQAVFRIQNKVMNGLMDDIMATHSRIKYLETHSAESASTQPLYDKFLQLEKWFAPLYADCTKLAEKLNTDKRLREWDKKFGGLFRWLTV